MNEYNYNGKILFIPDLWKNGSGPDCGGLSGGISCVGISCGNCILDSSNVNAFIEWQKTFKTEPPEEELKWISPEEAYERGVPKEPEPEYKYEIAEKDMVHGEWYMGRMTKTLYRKIKAPKGGVGLYDEQEARFFPRDKTCESVKAYLSSTDPAACTVGELADWEWCNAEGVIYRRIPHDEKNKNRRGIQLWSQCQKIIIWLSSDTLCIRIEEPEK